MILKKSHFKYNQRQRNGVFLLAALVLLMQLILFFADFSSTSPYDLNAQDLAAFEREMDSLERLARTENIPKIFPFNPSFISDFKGYQLGLSTSEIDRLLAHRAEGNYINSVKEFQKISGVSDSLLAVISPYFKFPEWVSKKKAAASRDHKYKPAKVFAHNDLNKLSVQQLKTFKGISESVAKRVLKYRKRLKGFTYDDQLYEVYGLKPPQVAEILSFFTVVTKPDITKLDINEASFKELLSLVYLDYELTQKIVAYREEVAEIQSLEELKQIEGFPIDKFDRIAVYLQTN